MRYRVEIKPAAERAARRLPDRDFIILSQYVESLADDQWPGNAIKLKAKEFWRIRVGRFRIIYRIDDVQKLVEIVKITRRNEATYKGL